MNRRDDCAGHLFATHFEKDGRNHAYGYSLRNVLQAKEPARARQYL